MLRRVHWVIIAAVVVSSCSSDLPHDSAFDPYAPVSKQARASLSGTVELENDGDPREATVTVQFEGGQETIKPVEDGSFLLAGIPPGLRTVRIDAPFYKGAEIPVEFAIGAKKTLDTDVTLLLKRTSVSGKVTVAAEGASNETPGGATVVLRQVKAQGKVKGAVTAQAASASVAGAISHTVTAQDDGTYRLDGVSAGIYSAIASKTQASSEPQEVTVDGDGAVTVADLVLKPLTGDFSIVAGAYTNTRAVALSLLGFNADKVQVGEERSGACSYPQAAFTYAVQYVYVLDDYDGEHVVCVRFLDNAGRTTRDYRRSVTLDRAAPSVASTAFVEGVYTKDTGVTLALDVTGADEMRITDATNPAGNWLTFATRVPYTIPVGADGAHWVWTTFRDRAGNEAGPIAVMIILDTSAPQFGGPQPMTINGMANPVTSSPVVSLAFSVTDAAEVRVSEDPFFGDAAWTPFTTSAQRTFLLSQGSGTKTLYVEFRDLAGNVLADSRDVTLDTRTITSPYVNVVEAVTSSTVVNIQASAGELSFAGTVEMLLSERSDFLGASWVAYQPFTTYTVTGVDGNKTIYAKFRTPTTNSGIVSDTFTLDRAGPDFAAVTVNNGAAYVGSQLVALGLLSTDAVSGVEGVLISENAGFSGAVRQPYSLTLAYPFLTDGPKTVYVRYYDRAGNASAPVSTSVVVDTAPPSLSLFQVEDGLGNAVATTNRSRVTVHVEASDVNPLQMLVSNRSDFAGSAWQPYQDHLLWDLALPSNPLGELRSVYVKLRDLAGNVTAPTSYPFMLDTIAPSGVGIDIVGDATTSPTVTVNFTFVNADSIEIASEIGFQNKLTFSAQASTSYTFSAGEGVKTLFARFKDLAGNVSEIVADSINLDAAPPQLADFTIEEGTATNQTMVHLRLTAIDALEMQIAENSCGGAWIPFAMSYAHALTSAAEGLKTIAVRYRDTALNATPCITKTVTLDQTGPTPVVLEIEAGVSFVTNRNVGVALAATGAAEFQLSESIVFTGASWFPYASQFSWTLSAGEGAKTLYARFRDAAGNVSGTLSDTVGLDTTVPAFNALSAPAVTNDTAVPLELTATGAFEMRLSADPAFTTAFWEFYDAAPIFTVAGAGSRTIYVQLRDGAGNESIVRSVVVNVDQTAPAMPSLAVLGGGYTKTPTLSLQVFATDSAEMLVSQFLPMTDASWQPYSQLKAFVLAGGEGAKTVYVRVRDAAGNVSPQASVGVILDQTAPVVTSYTARDGNGAIITATNQLRFYVALAVTDASPLTVQFSPTNVFAGAPVEALQPLRPWDTSVPTNSAGEIRTVYARVVDAAGNEFTVGPLSVLVDTLGPTGPSLVLSASLVSAPTVGVTLAASNADVAELSADIGFLSPVRFAYQAVTTFTLPGGDGAKTVYARFADANGNYSPIVAASVTLDQSPPQAAVFTIDQGALTNLTTVNLTLSAVDAVEMQIAENVCGGIWAPYSSSAAHPFTSATEGVKTIAVRFRDAALNRSACLTKSIVLDLTAPTFTSGTPVVINGDATSTTERAVTLSFAVTDATEMLVSENPSYVGANWVPFSPTYGWVLSAGEGSKSVFAKFRDAAKNETIDQSDAIAYVIATPSVSILNGPVTSNRTVQVQILANNAVEVLLSELPAMTGALWQSFSNVKSFQLADNDGAHTIYVRTRDALGNISGQAAASIVLDRQAPYFTVGFLPITINNDATSTTDRAVTLSFSVTQATEMIVSEDPGFTGGNWVPFSASSSWVLSAGDGQKTVYAKFRDAAGNQTTVVNDTIFIAPSTPSVTILGGAFTRFTNINVQILSSNATEVLLSQYAPMTDATWQPYNAVKAFSLVGADGLKVVYVRVRDGVGNLSGQAQATVTLDRVAPNISYFKPVDAFGAVIGYSTQTRYFLAVTATDLSQPMTVQMSPYNGFIGATPFEYISNTLFPWDAEPAADPAGEVRSTYLKMVDAAGNIGYAGPVTVLVDNVGVEQSGNSSMQVSPNPTSSPTVNVALTSLTAASVDLSEDPLFISPPPISFAMQAATTYTFTGGDGLKVLWARFRDSGGFPENPVSAATVLDTDFPQNVTFSIAEAPTAPTLTITIVSGTVGADEMQISDVACGSGPWVPFEVNKPFSFTSGVNGMRTIYVRYRDFVNHQSPCVARTVLLDTSAPSVNSIWPYSGSVGTWVYLYGTNLGTAFGQVLIGGVSAYINSWNDTQITAQVPEGAPLGEIEVVAIIDGRPMKAFPFVVGTGITGISTSIAHVGEQVRVVGGNFGVSQGTGVVVVGGIPAPVVTWAPTYIDFLVPDGVGAKAQPVYVVAGGFTSNTVTLNIRPHITALSPATGPSGILMTVTGTNFGFTQGSKTILINGANPPVVSWSNTTIVLEITDLMAPGLLPIQVVHDTLNSNFVYFEHQRPYIDLTYPANVTSGEQLWVVGRYFGNVTGEVFIGGASAPIESWTDGAIAVTVPALAVTGNTTVWVQTNLGYLSNIQPMYIRHADEWTTTDFPLERSEGSLVWTGSEMLVWGGRNINSDGVQDGWRYNPATDSWLRISAINQPNGRTYHTAVWTGAEMLIWGGNAYDTATDLWNYTNTGALYDPLTDSWRPMSLTNAPEARIFHASVWTGSEVIIFAGEVMSTYSQSNSGGIYNLATDTWYPLPSTGAPAARIYAQAVWAGDRVLVYGGLDDWGWDPIEASAQFDPVSRTWSPMATLNSAGVKALHSLVWTGSELLVWGGYNWGTWGETNTGSRYSPATDTWTVMNNYNQDHRAEHATVFSGTEMIVWSGCTWTWGCNDQAGARYNVATDSWQIISRTLPNAAPGGTGEVPVPAVWTGSEMIVFGGTDWWEHNDGGRYNPANNTWVGLNFTTIPAARMAHSAIWTGSEMIIWGGNNETALGNCWSGLSDGHRFSPATNSWQAITGSPIAARGEHSTVWTGSEMIIWGGGRAWCGYSYYNNGARFTPATGSWVALSASPLLGRIRHTAVWTGSKMLIWGGFRGASVADGAAWDVTNDTWQLLPTLRAPSLRHYHTAVWAGDQMIVWGGINGATPQNTGARYWPASNTWYTLPVTDAPSARNRHTAVWTGTEMLVWGGMGAASVRAGDGARYDPVLNVWYPTPVTTNSPTARWKHSAVWTGSEMIVWGGDDNVGTLVSNTGARFDPLTLQWLPITLAYAPISRHSHSAVWTGREMIVWGGAFNSVENKTASGGKYYPY